MALPTAEHFARAQFTTVLDANTNKVTASANSTAFTGLSGSYYIYSTVAAYALMGVAPITDPTTATAPIVLAAGQMAGPFWFDANADAVEIINASGAGEARLIKVGP